MFLVDTDVVSGLRSADRNRELTEWISAQRTTDLFLSVVTAGEIERGIAQQSDRSPVFAGALAAWLDQLLDWCGDRVLDVGVATARRWGAFSKDRQLQRRFANRRHRTGSWINCRHQKRSPL